MPVPFAYTHVTEPSHAGREPWWYLGEGDAAKYGYHVGFEIPGDPLVRGYYRREGEQLILVRIEIAAEPPTGVTSATLRTVQLDDIHTRLRRHLLEWGQGAPSDSSAGLAASNSKTLAKRGPRGKSDAFYRGVALDYLDLLHSGVARGINPRLAIQRDESVEKIKYWVDQAKERGFLAKGTAGRAGRDQGPRLGQYKPRKPGTRKHAEETT